MTNTKYNFAIIVERRKARRDELAAEIVEIRRSLREEGVTGPAANLRIRAVRGGALHHIVPNPTPANIRKEADNRLAWLANTHMPEGLPCGEDDAWLEWYDGQVQYTESMTAYLAQVGA